MIKKYHINKRRHKNKKATSKKHLRLEENMVNKPLIKKNLCTTSALDLLFQWGLIDHDCVLAGKQYALIKYMRPVGAPSGLKSSLRPQNIEKQKTKQDWSDSIIHDELEDVWRESLKITKSSMLMSKLDKILVNNAPEDAVEIIRNEEDFKMFCQILRDLSTLYKHHKSTKLLIEEIT